MAKRLMLWCNVTWCDDCWHSAANHFCITWKCDRQHVLHSTDMWYTTIVIFTNWFLWMAGSGFSTCHMTCSTQCTVCSNTPTTVTMACRSTRHRQSTQTTSCTFSSSADSSQWFVYWLCLSSAPRLIAAVLADIVVIVLLVLAVVVVVYRPCIYTWWWWWWWSLYWGKCL